MSTTRASLAARVLAVLAFVLLRSACSIAAEAPPAWPALVEEDWLRQAEAKPAAGQSRPGTTREDAAGACDGVKDGKYAFHTAQEPNPWWQVDLGEPQAISKVVVYNRLDYAPGLHNADNLLILTSDDGKAWKQVYDNKGKHFGGVSGAKPLEVAFGAPPSPPYQGGDKGGVRARFVRLQIPSSAPIFFHLDEVEVYGSADPAKNLALHRPADQSSTSQWSTVKAQRAETGVSYPIAAVIERGRRLAADIKELGADTQPHERALDEIAARLLALPADAPAEARRALYLDARSRVRRLVFANPLLNFEKLIFVKRFTQESYPDVCLNHMPWVSRPGGDICVLTRLSPDGEVRPLLNGALGPGHVHGMDLWWDGDRVVFGYAKAKSDQPPQGWLDRSASYRLRRTEEPIHLFEIGVDGKGLRQVTSGEWSDLDPTYLPSGDIAFVSERCGTSLQCNEYDKDETSCNLYVMHADGNGIRRLSVSKDGDYVPHALNDGTIGYTRWEYHERSFAFIQSLWFVRPDGTGADATFKQHLENPWALYDARSIPGSHKLVAVAGGHHTLYCGPVVVVDRLQGMSNSRGIAIVTPNVRPQEGGMSGFPVPEGGVQDAGGIYQTPWALSDRYFLVSYSPLTLTMDKTDPTGYALYLIDVYGNKELIYRDPKISCFFPIPLRARPKPPVLPDVTDSEADYATCLLSDVVYGVDGVKPGQVRYLRIAEPVGWPYDNKTGGQRYGEDHGFGGPGAERKNLINWTPVRILGDVPLESDGSAHFRVPVDTAVYFQLLDENHMELRRMRSFISFQKGERRGCVGCHETRAVAPLSGSPSLAAQREPSVPTPLPWGDRSVSFLRDVQPVLDKHCVSCHAGVKPAGGLDFSGGLTSHNAAIPGYGYNRAFETILEKGLVSRSPARAQDASITPPFAYGSHKSKLVQALRSGPCSKRASLSGEDWLRLNAWIDANAPYHDAFVNKRPEKPAYDIAADKELEKSIAAVHEKRCGACHKTAEVSRLDWIALRRPAQSLFLVAPLAKDAGGTGRCKEAVYKDAKDPDYQTLLKTVETAVQRAWGSPRRDLKALVP